jgi:hypothetical protein
MSVGHAPSVTTVFGQSPSKAWVVRSLFTSLRRNVRGLRCRVPIPACASPSARARAFGNRRCAGGGNRHPTGYWASRFSLCGSSRQAPANPDRAPRRGRCHRVRLFGSGRRLRGLPHCQCRACFGAFAHRADCRRDDPCCSARPVPIRMGARRGVGCFRRGRRGRWSGCSRRRASGASSG